MKSVYSYLFIALAAILLVGCVEDASRMPELQSGASFRIDFPDPQYAMLNFNEPETAMLQFNIFTVNDDIGEATLSLTYFNNAQQQQYDTVVIRSYTQSDFDAEGAIWNVQITPQDIATALGISQDIMGGSDVIEVFTEVRLLDGRVFPNEVVLPNRTVTNIEPTILGRNNPSFSTGFVAYIACPLPDDFAVGTYRVEQIAGPSDPFFGNDTRWATEEVTLTAPSTINRSFEGTYLTFDVGFSLQFVCGSLTVPTTGAGVGCGAGLAWRSASATAYDLESDQEFVIELLDNVNGDCGLPREEPLTLRLTKVN